MSDLTAETSDYIERYYAEMEGARNAAEDDYFKARPQLLRTLEQQALFRAGFERAFKQLWRSVEPRERLPVRIELKGDKEVCWGQSRGQHCVFITQLDHVGKQGETVPDAEREKVKDVADFALIVDSEERAKEIADCLCGRRPQFETNGERP